eukprot:scaffold156364_cov29-Prasinocladus_malaysianus.AAC.1
MPVLVSWSSGSRSLSTLCQLHDDAEMSMPLRLPLATKPNKSSLDKIMGGFWSQSTPKYRQGTAALSG